MEPRELLETNCEWSERINREQPGFLPGLCRCQHPVAGWIGCSDSRTPSELVVQASPGQLFVHRNIANQVVHGDDNTSAFLQYAVDALRVPHLIVCGHYGCGGVRAAFGPAQPGALENWLRPIRELIERHAAELEQWSSREAREDRVCELHLRAQVDYLAGSALVREAWRAGRPLAVHGWMYCMTDGRLVDLGITRDGME